MRVTTPLHARVQLFRPGTVPGQFGLLYAATSSVSFGAYQGWPLDNSSAVFANSSPFRHILRSPAHLSSSKPRQHQARPGKNLCPGVPRADAGLEIKATGSPTFEFNTTLHQNP